MRLHVTVTDTNETATYEATDEDGFRRFLGNCLATIDVSKAGADGYEGPSVVIRWVPDTDATED